MRVAITADVASETAPVSMVFGRCPYYAIYDTNTGSLDFVANPGGMMPRGAGVQAAQFLIEQGVNTLVTAGVAGPNASMILAQAGIQVVNGFQGRIIDAVEAIKNGNLKIGYTQVAPAPMAQQYMPVEISPEEEIRMLEEEAARIKERLEEIRKRLGELNNQ